MQVTNEVRMAMSHPPTPKAVRPSPKSPQELAHYQEDMTVYNRLTKEDQAALATWKQAKELLEQCGHIANEQMRLHDNDFGAVGKHDLNYDIGVMAYQERTNDYSCNVFGRSTKVPLPKHFWQKQQYATVVTEFNYASGPPGRTPTFHRDYSAALSDQKYPTLIWESASQTSRGQGPKIPDGQIQVQADYSNDSLVWRQLKETDEA